MSLISAQTVERLKAEVGTLQPMGEIWATARVVNRTLLDTPLLQIIVNTFVYYYP